MLVFEKKVQETDIKKRFAIPTSALHLLEIAHGDSEDLLVKDSNTGDVWVFPCCTRNGLYPKPEIRGGWLDFVRSKGLRIGDRVLFYKEGDHAASGILYKIEAKRATSIMGQQVWGEIST